MSTPTRTEAEGDAVGARNAIDFDRAEAAVRELLIAVGEDPDREGLLETPARVARAYAETFAGLNALCLPADRLVADAAAVGCD